MALSVKEAFVNRWLPSLASAAMVAGGFMVRDAYWKGGVEHRLRTVELHASDTVVHMPDAVKFSTFARLDDITRIERAVRDLTAEVRALRAAER
jgi:hypothetical protein